MSDDFACCFALSLQLGSCLVLLARVSEAYNARGACRIRANQSLVSLYRLLTETTPRPISFENMLFNLAFVCSVLVTISVVLNLIIMNLVVLDKCLEQSTCFCVGSLFNYQLTTGRSLL
jgi:hypothetical protein